MTIRNSNTVTLEIDTPVPLPGQGWEIRLRSIGSVNDSAILGHWRGFKFSKVLSDVGSGEVTLDLDDPLISDNSDFNDRLYSLIDEQFVINFYYDGVWQYAIVNDQPVQTYVDSSEVRALEVSGEGIGSIMSWTTILSPQIFATYALLKWTWTATSAMAAWWDLWADGDSRTASVFRTRPTFSTSADSKGVPWADSQDIEIELGSNMLERLKQFAELSAADWQVYLADTGLSYYSLKVAQSFGVDRSSTVRFYVGKNQILNQVTRDRKNIANVVYVNRPDSFTTEVVDEDSLATWTRREAFVQAPNATDNTAIQRFAELLLANNKDQLVSIAIKITPDTGTRPLTDFDVGDFIWCESPDGVLDGSYKVTAISVSVDDTGNEDWELTLVSNLELKLIQIQRKINQTTQASLAGATNIDTSPPDTPAIIEDSAGNQIPGTGVPGDPYQLPDATAIIEIIPNTVAAGSVDSSPVSDAGISVAVNDNAGVTQYALTVNQDMVTHPSAGLSYGHMGVFSSDVIAGSGTGINTYSNSFINYIEDYNVVTATSPTSDSVVGNSNRCKITLTYSGTVNSAGSANAAWDAMIEVGMAPGGANAVLNAADLTTQKLGAQATKMGSGSNDRWAIRIPSWPVAAGTYTWYLSQF